MAATVTQNTNNSRIARDKKAAVEATPNLPSDKFSITLHILQEYLEIEDECALPKLWHMWANSIKCQEYNILERNAPSLLQRPGCLFKQHSRHISQISLGDVKLYFC